MRSRTSIRPVRRVTFNLDSTQHKNLPYDNSNAKSSHPVHEVSGDLREETREENGMLIQILQHKNKEITQLEARLANLEQEFLHYKATSKQIVSNSKKGKFHPSNVQLMQESTKVFELLKHYPDTLNLANSQGVYPRIFTQLIKDNKLAQALSLSLSLLSRLTSPVIRDKIESERPKSVASPLLLSTSDEQFEELACESTYLLQNITKQSAILSRLLSRSNSLQFR